MKKNSVFQTTLILVIALTFCFTSCASTGGSHGKLAVPSNVEISVVGRWATVSWNAVDNASGYIVYTESVGCASGNRISNTATHTFTNHGGETLTSTYPANGSVEFPGATSIRIWLMAAMSGDTTAPMATELTAKVKAVNTADDSLDSDYSRVTSISKSHYHAADNTDAHNDTTVPAHAH